MERKSVDEQVVPRTAARQLARAIDRALRPARKAVWPLMGVAVLGGVVVATQLPVTSAVYARATPPAMTSAMPASFADMVERTRPSVVAVVTRSEARGSASHGAIPPGLLESLPPGHPMRRFFGPGPSAGAGAPRMQGMGSGFIVDDSGLVVTNNHVISGADEITVVLHDGTRVAAKVRGADSKTDLALLEIETDKPLVAATFGDSDGARVGDWVVAVGSPFGLGGSYTAGIISARGRDINSGPYDDYLQVDAPINRGNSGGALLNTRGEVIGVNTAIYSPNGGNVGIGFAVPARIAKDVVADLRDDGVVQRGWLGVRIQTVSPELADSLRMDEARGALVAGVSAGSPAAKGGLRPGDVVLKVDGEAVERMRDLPRLVAELDSGSEHRFEVWRDGKPAVVSVKVGEAPSERLASANQPQALGLALAPLDAQLRSRFRLDEDSAGIAIVGVEPGSPAARAGLRPGMVIERVQRQPVSEPGDLTRALEQARADAGAGDRHAVLLLIAEADGGKRFVALTLG